MNWVNHTQLYDMARFTPLANSPMPESSPPGFMEITDTMRSRRNPSQLDFDAAMNNFQTMFPGMDSVLIESVLRKNMGSVDKTIDELLAMSSDTSLTVSDIAPKLPPKPNLSPDNDASPSLPPRESSLKLKLSRIEPPMRHEPLKRRGSEPLSSKPAVATVHKSAVQTRFDAEWNGMNIPLLGKLPANFLRLEIEETQDTPPPRPPKTLHRTHSARQHSLPMHLAERPSDLTHNTHSLPGFKKNKKGHFTTGVGERLSTNALKRQIEANHKRLQETSDLDVDSESEQFLNDERLALIMQNEEFLRELKRNEDFMKTLEFERDLLAKRLVMEQQKNKALRRNTSEEPTHDLISRQIPHIQLAGRTTEKPSDSTPTASSTASGSLDSESANTLNSKPLTERKLDKMDIHDFRDQLRSMGATSKKKFAQIAKKFFVNTRSRKKILNRSREGVGLSTVNLLTDEEDDSELFLRDQHEENVDVAFEPLPVRWPDQHRSDDDHFL